MLKQFLLWILLTFVVEFIIGPIGGRIFDLVFPEGRNWTLPNFQLYQPGYLTVAVASLALGAMLLRWRPGLFHQPAWSIYTVRKRGLRLEATNLIVTQHRSDEQHDQGRVSYVSVSLINELKRPISVSDGNAVSIRTGRSFDIYIDPAGFVPINAIYAIPPQRRVSIGFFMVEPETVERRLATGAQVRRVHPASHGNPTIAQFAATHSGFDFILTVDGKRTTYRVPNSYVDSYRIREREIRVQRELQLPIEVKPEWSNPT
ncbi:MAG: hypothetical protein AB7P20_21960 [Rhizobiaceae bacterium]